MLPNSFVSSVVNERTQVDENLYFRSIDKSNAAPARRDQTHGVASTSGQVAAPPQLQQIGEEEPPRAEEEPSKREMPKQPPYLFHNAQSLESLTRKHNVSRLDIV